MESLNVSRKTNAVADSFTEQGALGIVRLSNACYFIVVHFLWIVMIMLLFFFFCPVLASFYKLGILHIHHLFSLVYTIPKKKSILHLPFLNKKKKEQKTEERIMFRL